METNANQKVTCLANYAYEASEPDELSLRAGDQVREVERLSGGWWRGELRGRRGMFPDNFVSVLDHASPRSGGAQGRCRAVFSYQPANPDELPLSVGDVLEVLGEVEEGWWQGRRQGRVGVFPSNFVVMQDPPAPAAAPPFEPAPALPPKPVKELCRVLFPYAAVNDDELTLAEGEVVTVLSKEAPDRGWWRGEVHGRVGLFPDNFVQLIPATQDAEEKKPERLPPKSPTPLYPVLKFTENTNSLKEITTSKTSLHKDSNKELSAQSTVTHTNKSVSEKITHNETISDGNNDAQLKKPPVPTKKSPTPAAGVVGGLLSGLKNKMLSSSDKEKSVSSSASNSSGEWDKPDGATASRPAPLATAPAAAPAAALATTPANASTFDQVERNSILNDPRAARVKAPGRRPPSQALRDDTPQQLGLSNGHEVPTERPPPAEKAEEIKPKAREWDRHKAPWMEELKKNQAIRPKKSVPIAETGKSRSVASETVVVAKTSSGSTDRILEVGLEEKRSMQAVEMSKSTSSIASRISVHETSEDIKQETKVRHSLESKKDSAPGPPRDNDAVVVKSAVSPTAAGRTLTAMLEEIKKPAAPAPPSASVRTNLEPMDQAKANGKPEKTTITSITEKFSSASVIDKSSSITERFSIMEEKPIDKCSFNSSDRTGSTLERRLHGLKGQDTSDSDMLVAQLNNRISNLEKLLEVQNAKFNAAIEELTRKLALETEKRQALQTEVDKLAHCVTQV